MCIDYDYLKNCKKCVYCNLTDAKSIQDIEEITKYWALINHSDCDFGYVSFEYFGINQDKYPCEKFMEWGNLDRLKKELKWLKNEDNRQLWRKDIWDAFEELYEDVMENPYPVLEFH